MHVLLINYGCKKRKKSQAMEKISIVLNSAFPCIQSLDHVSQEFACKRNNPVLPLKRLLNFSDVASEWKSWLLKAQMLILSHVLRISVLMCF